MVVFQQPSKQKENKQHNLHPVTNHAYRTTNQTTAASEERLEHRTQQNKNEKHGGWVQHLITGKSSNKEGGLAD